MRITVDIDPERLRQVQAFTGEKIKSRAVACAVDSFLKQRTAREFGRLLREGAFDYPATNEDIEALDR